MTASTEIAKDGGAALQWHVGDWAVFDLKIVQIKEMRDGGGVSVSDGSFETSGRLQDRLRPLTLRNKAIIEYFDYYYCELRKLDGQAGFNYPDISWHFSNLALKAIDGAPEDTTNHDLASEFLVEAKRYTLVIQGVHLFRPNRAALLSERSKETGR